MPPPISSRVNRCSGLGSESEVVIAAGQASVCFGHNGGRKP